MVGDLVEKTLPEARDTLYANPVGQRRGFRFDQRVAEVFPDMIKRSVPGYSTIVSMTGELAERYARDDSQCYDLGCSLGASTLAMRHRIRARNCRIIAIDNSQPMLARARAAIDLDSATLPVDCRHEDLRQCAISRASIVVLNFTLQFIPQDQRDAIIDKIFRGLLPGGVLILSEKVTFADRTTEALMIELHHDFKRHHGYSELEIAQKRAALENTLVPETLAQHRQRLLGVGFSHCDTWFQCFNFASIIAIKAQSAS